MAVVGTVGETGNPLVDGLTWGTRWGIGSQRVVLNIGYSTAFGAAPTATERAAILAMLDQFEHVLNIDLRWVGADSAGTADIRFLFRNDTAASFIATGEPPGTGSLDADGNASSTITVSRPFLKEPANPSFAPGSFNAMILAHEFGHALGLSHPHDGGAAGSDQSLTFPGISKNVSDLGSHALNQGINTMMSYNYGWVTGEVPITSPRYGYTSGPMALDIQALQFIYGANAHHNDGNTITVLPQANMAGTGYSCLWDTGGIDTIMAPSGTYAQCRIDLRAASGKVDAYGGGPVSFLSGVAGGVTIAKGVVIERAVGGLGNDVLIGNGAANVLVGQGGVDRLFGGRGSDVFDFNRLSDSAGGLAGPDRIMDFHPGEDKIDLRTIDANGLVAGNQAFALHMGAGFTGAGQVRISFTSTDTLVHLNTDRDGTAESVLLLVGRHHLGSVDFLL